MGIPLAHYLYMQLNERYDVAIAGGGLSGLAAAILLRRAGYSVILFEKEKYPFHKLCGEYVSMESWDFLSSLGLPLDKMDLPRIQKLQLTSTSGRTFRTALPLGGFGISRYLMDASLAEIATREGVHLLEEAKVEHIHYHEHFEFHFNAHSYGKGKIYSTVSCIAHGKRSNLDVKWNRNFLAGQHKKSENYIAVKYHVLSNGNKDEIGLHNFENGYCGFSAIEDNRFCLCYMTKASELKRAGNSIESLQENLLYRNPVLKEIFQNIRICESFPITISQISFDEKTRVENGMLMLGDAAGMIAPLCGNGMSIALHSASIAAHCLDRFLQGGINRMEMEQLYTSQWKKNFESRMRVGRFIQRFFGSNRQSDLLVRSFLRFPFLARPVVKMTHGRPF